VSGHLGSHSDGDIFYWISNGLPGGMPVWKSTLTDTERWELVDYLRSINGAVPAAGSAPGGPATRLGASGLGTASDGTPVGALLGLPVGFGLLGAGFAVRALRPRGGRRPGHDRGRRREL
jgi:hypothetical protein